MPIVNTVFDFGELKIRNEFVDEVRDALRKPPSGTELYTVMVYLSSQYRRQFDRVHVEMHHTELFRRFCKMPVSHQQAFVEAVRIAVLQVSEKLNDKAIPSFELEFDWAPGRRRRMAIKHRYERPDPTQSIDEAIQVLTLEMI